MTNKIGSNSKQTIVAVAIAALFVVFGLYGKGSLFINGPKSPVGSAAIKAYAERVVMACSGENYRPSCYDKEIPKLMDEISMEEAFKVTSVIQGKDPSYLNCHVLAHNLGERETAKDPSKWKDVVTKCPVTMCNNGCPHGIMMERFKENINDYLTEEQIESIKSDLADVCEPRGTWHPRPVEQSMCYHAMGHLNMYITNAKIEKSIELCRDIGTKPDGRNYVQTCTEGVFMIIYQPLGSEDISLVQHLTPSQNDKNKFCAPYKNDTLSFHACNKESWAIFRSETITSEGLTEFCSYTNDEYWQMSCYMSIMNPITDLKVVYENNIKWLRDFCDDLMPKWRGTCISGAVHRLVQHDPKLAPKAVEICKLSNSMYEEIENKCWRTLANYGWEGFLPGTKELSEYCGLLPGEWQNSCLTAQQQ